MGLTFAIHAIIIISFNICNIKCKCTTKSAILIETIDKSYKKISTNVVSTITIIETTYPITTTALLKIITTSELSTTIKLSQSVTTPTRITTEAPSTPNYNCQQFSIKYYEYLDPIIRSQLFNGVLIWQGKLNPNQQTLTCACAGKCFANPNCVYFESESSSNNCFLYKFRNINSTLIQKIQGGIYLLQSSTITCGFGEPF